jgi:Tol biopolymer transport system component
MQTPAKTRFLKSASIIFVCIMSINSVLYAQPVADGSPQPLLNNSDQFIRPHWSPTVNQLAFTQPGFDGIWTYDLNSEQLLQITELSGTGYGFSWAADGSHILTRSTKFEGRRNSHAVALISANGSSEELLTDYIPAMPALPSWRSNSVNYVHGEEHKQIKQVLPARKALTSHASAFIKDNELVLYRDGQENVIQTPFQDERLLNVVLSPDQSTIAFEVYGGNLFTYSISSGNLVDHGQGNRPSFSPDGQYIIYMQAEDNGHDYTKSDLIASSIDGNTQVNLTSDTDLICLNPSWSPDGKQIAFDEATEDRIYLLPVSFEVQK